MVLLAACICCTSMAVSGAVVGAPRTGGMLRPLPVELLARCAACCSLAAGAAPALGPADGAASLGAPSPWPWVWGTAAANALTISSSPASMHAAVAAGALESAGGAALAARGAETRPVGPEAAGPMIPCMLPAGCPNCCGRCCCVSMPPLLLAGGADLGTLAGPYGAGALGRGHSCMPVLVWGLAWGLPSPADAGGVPSAASFLLPASEGGCLAARALGTRPTKPVLAWECSAGAPPCKAPGCAAAAGASTCSPLVLGWGPLHGGPARLLLL
jgi:hypothetical protein